jgi:hypothetical protein
MAAAARQRWRTAGHLTTLFLVAWGIRLLFFQGCILGDDPNDIGAAYAALERQLQFTVHWELRIFLWLFIALAQKVLGVSEWSLFLSTWIFSSTLSLVAYLTMTRFGYRGSQAFLAGLFVATAPYEVLIGSLHSSDLFLEWFLAVGFLVLFTQMRSQILHGVVLAVILWGAFYNKFWWSFFFLPVLGIYFLRELHYRHIQMVLAFGLSTLILHSATSIFWRIETGRYFPFAETVKIGLIPYVIQPADLWRTFAVYPKMIFQGSEFHTTLFGAVPYLFIGFLVIKGGLALGARRTVRFDALDLWLLLFNGSLVLFINYFPCNFKFDHYYSSTRIFRYLAPISFPLALHTGKLAVDLASAWNQRFSNRSGFLKSFPVVVFWILLLSTNLAQAAQATRPGRAYRAAFFNGVREVRRMKPPRVVVDCWMRGFWTMQLATSGPLIPITSPCKPGLEEAKEQEAWIRDNEANWEPGTALVTGVGNYVHYGCHHCGPRLRLFSQPLSPRWTFYADLGLQDYLPTPEDAALWVLQPLGPEVQGRKVDLMGGAGRVGKFLQEFNLLLLDPPTMSLPWNARLTWDRFKAFLARYPPE